MYDDDRESLSPPTNRRNLNTSSTSFFTAPPEPFLRHERKDPLHPSPPVFDLVRQEKKENSPSLKSVQEVKKRFPAGVALLDPVENMGIVDEAFKKLLRVSSIVFLIARATTLIL